MKRSEFTCWRFQLCALFSTFNEHFCHNLPWKENSPLIGPSFSRPSTQEGRGTWLPFSPLLPPPTATQVQREQFCCCLVLQTKKQCNGRRPVCRSQSGCNWNGHINKFLVQCLFSCLIQCSRVKLQWCIPRRTAAQKKSHKQRRSSMFNVAKAQKSFHPHTMGWGQGGPPFHSTHAHMHTAYKCTMTWRGENIGRCLF